MKNIFFFLLLTCTTAEIFAQGKYGGGNGNGFSHEYVGNIVLAQSGAAHITAALWPVPAGEEIFLDWKSKPCFAELTDVSGKVVFREEIVPGIQLLRFGPLPAGMYIFRADHEVQKIEILP